MVIGGSKEEIETILPQRLYYLQSLGSLDFVHDKAYTHAILRTPQPTNLDKHEAGQSLLDYKESSNITDIETAEVITDFEFIDIEDRKGDTIVFGPFMVGLQLRIRGDGTYTTFMDSVRVTLFSRTSAGSDTTIFTSTFTWDTAPSHSADSWDDKVGAALRGNIPKKYTIDKNSRLVLRVEVFAHASSASATDNLVRLYFSRGSSESYIYLPMDEVL